MRVFAILFLVSLLMTAAQPERRFVVFRIAFGYKDARPARFVGDIYEKLEIAKEVMRPCQTAQRQDCGFRRALDDGDLFIREIPTPKGYRLVLHLRITASAASPDDEENRHDRFQTYLSQMSEENFLSGVARAEATIYVGHSRDGGGPDFSPPRLKRDRHVDYSWYKKSKPGLSRLIATLKKKNRPARRGSEQVLGLVSCRSTQLFARSVLAANKRVNLIAADELVYYADGLAQARLALSKVIIENL